MNRDDAWALVEAHTESDSLRKHMRSVATAMAWYARHFGEDEDRWWVTGALHDFDYEAHPSEHPWWGVNLLRERGVDEDVLDAILGHAAFTGTPRVSLMSRTLFAVDELTGLITAAVLVRPDRSILGLELKSVLKKFRDKAFARGVNRDEVIEGARDLGVEFDVHVANVLEAMRGSALELGLTGA